MNRQAVIAVCGLALALLASGPVLAASGRVIVGLSADADAQRSAATVSERVAPLARRAGLSLSGRAGPAPDTLVVSASGIDSATLAARLAGDATVRYAVPDARRLPLAVPSDPLYPQQWFLHSSEAAAVRADLAWDQVTGSSDVVVAVLDTGVRFDHEDLAGRLLSGYDFISDTGIANDGDGRDADASDPGDYLTQADIDSGDFDCSTVPEASTWHGTRIAGLIAAAGNNAVGVSGTLWQARILPLRVLGKCGGYDSDIIAAMRWAAGLSVPGVPDNTNPAQIVNLSLGGDGSCPDSYQDVVTALTAQGVLVVAAAGNSSSGAVQAPANCSGVLAVAGLRNDGTKASYSSIGSAAGIAAPGGNCSSLSCEYPVISTINLGQAVPAANGYSDASDTSVGTSFSSAIVSGIAGLMLSANPSLDRSHLFARLQSSARAFPSDPTLPTCPQEVSSGSRAGLCNCTTSTCGAGMADAAGAVGAALAPVSSISAGSAVLGSPLAVDGSGSAAAPGASIVQWQWSVVSGPGSAQFDDASAATTYLRADAAGDYVIALAVTDDAGRSDSATRTVTVSAAASTGTSSTQSSGGGGGGSLDAWAVLALLGLVLAARQTGRPSSRK